LWEKGGEKEDTQEGDNRTNSSEKKGGGRKKVSLRFTFGNNAFQLIMMLRQRLQPMLKQKKRGGESDKEHRDKELESGNPEK